VQLGRKRGLDDARGEKASSKEVGRILGGGGVDPRVKSASWGGKTIHGEAKKRRSASYSILRRKRLESYIPIDTAWALLWVAGGLDGGFFGAQGNEGRRWPDLGANTGTPNTGGKHEECMSAAPPE